MPKVCSGGTSNESAILDEGMGGMVLWVHTYRCAYLRVMDGSYLWLALLSEVVQSLGDNLHIFTAFHYHKIKVLKPLCWTNAVKHTV